MPRELILFSADLTKTAWHQSRADLDIDSPEGVSFTVVTDTWTEADSSEILELSKAQSRLDAGDACVLGRDHETGAIAYCLWLAKRPVYLDWIFGVVTPLPDHRLLYNAWVEPGHRGASLHWAGAVTACQYLVSCGQPHLCAGVEYDEFKPFASKYAQMGLALIKPYASLWGVRVFGQAFHVTRPPRRALCRIRADLKARYASHFPGAS